MALDSELLKAMPAIASQYAEADLLPYLQVEDATMIADHILAQPEALQKELFGSHHKSVTDLAKNLLEAQEKLSQATDANRATLKTTLNTNYEMFSTSMIESGVGVDMLLKETNAKITELSTSRHSTPEEPILEKASHAETVEKMSKTKMAVIGGAVALGAYAAYALFNKEHPEHNPDTQQR